MENFLRYLDGRKAILAAVCGLIITYLVKTNVIDGDLGVLVLSVINLLAGGAVIATDKVLGSVRSRSRY